MYKTKIPKLPLSWFVLSIIGINHYHQDKLKPVAFYKRILRLIFPTLLVASYFWNSFYIYQSLGSRVVKVVVPRIFIYTFELFLWYSLHKNRANLRELREAMCGWLELELHCKKSSKVHLFFNVIIVFAFTLPCLKTISIIIVTEGCTKGFGCNFYIMGKVTDDITLWQILFITAGINIVTILQLTFPLTVICIYCDICLTCKEIVASVKIQMRDITYDKFSSHIADQYRQAWKTGKLLKDSFSSAMICFILAQILNLFLCLAMITFKAEDKPVNTLSSAANIAFYSSTFMATVEVAAQVADEFEDIVLKLRVFSEEIVFGFQDKKNKVLLNKIHAMIQKKPIVLSAYGIVYMKRKLIFVIFGSILTYGLLLLEHFA